MKRKKTKMELSNKSRNEDKRPVRSIKMKLSFIPFRLNVLQRRFDDAELFLFAI